MIFFKSWDTKSSLGAGGSRLGRLQVHSSFRKRWPEDGSGFREVNFQSTATGGRSCWIRIQGDGTWQERDSHCPIRNQGSRTGRCLQMKHRSGSGIRGSSCLHRLQRWCFPFHQRWSCRQFPLHWSEGESRADQSHRDRRPGRDC